MLILTSHSYHLKDLYLFTTWEFRMDPEPFPKTLTNGGKLHPLSLFMKFPFLSFAGGRPGERLIRKTLSKKLEAVIWWAAWQEKWPPHSTPEAMTHKLNCMLFKVLWDPTTYAILMCSFINLVKWQENFGLWGAYQTPEQGLLVMKKNRVGIMYSTPWPFLTVAPSLTLIIFPLFSWTWLSLWLCSVC